MANVRQMPQNLVNQITYTGGRTLSYTYDCNGIRTSKTVNGVTHTYELNGSIIIKETWGNNQLVPIYDVTGSILGILYNSTPYYFMRNLQGDVIGVVNNSGTLVAEYSYDAWGKCSIVGDISGVDIANVNLFRYRGYYYDSEIGLYYCNARYYDPAVGRWISPDSISYLDQSRVSGVNLYTYCYDDHINKYDPLGHFALSSFLIGLTIGFCVGLAIGGGVEIVKQAYNGSDWNWDITSWNWGQIGLSALGGGVAGAISSVSFGSGAVAWITTFIFGGVGSVVGGYISGSVTNFDSAGVAFILGGVANIAAKGITVVINKGITAHAQKGLNHFMFDDMTLSDLVGSGLQNNGYNPIYNKLLDQVAKYIMRANGQWARSFMYLFANAGISSLLSGWY